MPMTSRASTAPAPANARRRLRPLVGVGLLAAVAMTAGLAIFLPAERDPLLLAPMIGGLEPCLFGASQGGRAALPEGSVPCEVGSQSAAARVEATLQRFGQLSSRDGRYALGYTLNAPLLRFLTQREAGWEVDQQAVQTLVRTIREVDRPVVLYLFSNHFGVGAPIERRLAEQPDNLMKTAQGVMRQDKYYSVDIYPWSFTTTRNDITRQREKVVAAILGEVCRLPQPQIDKIRAVTLLGELHHLFPNFEGGMGYAGRYMVSDYSSESVTGFRHFLAARFESLQALNRALDADFARIEDVPAPSKDIRSEPLTNFAEHIDSFAHGELPISGWAVIPARTSAEPLWVRVYRNGEFVARVPVRYARQDVLHAFPEFKTADVGWSYQLDYSKYPRGMHLISVYLEQPREPLVRLATRRIVVMDKHQIPPEPQAQIAEPRSVEPDAGLRFHVDYPPDLSSYYFNPLVALWHEFRSHQVRAYLNHFQMMVAKSCIGRENIFAHQILPFSNPGWDSGKFSVGADLGVPQTLGLGVSLYGEASYGHSFFEWLDTAQRTSYGVTEFHPLRPLDPRGLADVLEHHQQRGARFVSFFLEPAHQNAMNGQVANIFSFDRRNQKFGSDVLADSVRKLMN
jgi:hypothetical protein